MRLLIAALGITALLALTTPSPRYTEGKATFYSRGLIQKVAAYRGITLDGASGFSTFPDCAKLGRSLWVSVLNPRTGAYSAWAETRVVDCSQTRHRAYHEQIHLVELSFEDAIKYGYKSEGKTRIRYYLGASR